MAVRLSLGTDAMPISRGEASIVKTLELADEVWLPFIVLGELRAGFAVGSQDRTTKPSYDVFS